MSSWRVWKTDWFFSCVFLNCYGAHKARALSFSVTLLANHLKRRRASVAFCCCLNSEFDDDALLSYHWSGVAKKAKLFLTLGQLWKLFFYLLVFWFHERFFEMHYFWESFSSQWLVFVNFDLGQGNDRQCCLPSTHIASNITFISCS